MTIHFVAPVATTRRRPLRRTPLGGTVLCLLSLALCEVTSFGMNHASSAAASRPNMVLQDAKVAVDLPPTGATKAAGAKLGEVHPGTLEQQRGRREGLLHVDEEQEDGGNEEPQLLPPGLPSLADGVRMELGKYKVDPFEERTFPAQYLYAMQKLQSDEDEAFGAAFISLRSASDQSPTRSWTIGKPRAERLLALHRFKLWWMMPTHMDKASDVPPETQMMLAKMPPDPKTGKQLYSLFVPLIDGSAKFYLKGLPDRSLQLLAETGCASTPVPSVDVAGLFVGVHEDPFKLVEKSFKLVNKRLRPQVKAGSTPGVGGLIRDAEKELAKWKKSEVISKTPDCSSPDFSRYLGWCTWDSFYTSVDHDKVFKGLESLHAAGVRPRWLVLDDGWQSTSNVNAANGEQWMDHLTSLWANKKFRSEKHGTDLARTVERAKKEFGIDYFMVWHAIAGYWAGVDLDSPDLLKYKPRRASLHGPPGIVEIDPDMKMFFLVSRFFNKRFGVVPPENIRAFYDDYHEYLKQQGVDGVKVDAQSVVNFLGPGHGGSVMLSRAFHTALSKSVTKHFSDTDGPRGEGGRIIHCMCHDSEILLQLPSCYGRKAVIRGSDDFYPRDKSAHGPHIYANAFNALLLANCGLQDWDMFQTGLGDASWMHAASRAISGGPVYISDRPGEHNMDILRRTVLDDGSVLKPPCNALPTLDSLFVDAQRDKGSLLSVWNECEVDGHGVVGIFNVYGSAWNQQRRAYTPVAGAKANGNGNSNGGVAGGKVVGAVHARDCHRLVRDLEEEVGGGVDPRAERYAVHLHHANTLAVGGPNQPHEVALGALQGEVAAISRVRRLYTADGEVEFASIGLADMFNAGGAIVSEDARTGLGVVPAMDLMVRGSGRFLAMCSRRPESVSLWGQPLQFVHGQTGEGVGYLEVQLPGPYDGTPRALHVEWASEPFKAGR